METETISQASALKMAKSLWGDAGHIEKREEWESAGLGCVVGFIEEDRFRIRGTGQTWSEAFYWAERIFDILDS